MSEPLIKEAPYSAIFCRRGHLVPRVSPERIARHGHRLAMEAAWCSDCTRLRPEAIARYEACVVVGRIQPIKAKELMRQLRRIRG